MTLEEWRARFEKWNLLHYQNDDASHDIYHFRRVAENAFQIATHYPVGTFDPFVLLAASYFHDVVNLPKDHPHRKKASELSADKAEKILRNMNFDEERLPAVKHAILTHSYSANIPPETLDAKILQDADRIDGFGAIGIIRALYVSGRLNRSLFDKADPLAMTRPLDDEKFGLDHFETKILKMPKHLKTDAGKKLADPRVEIVVKFRKLLSDEIVSKQEGYLSRLARAFFVAGKEKKFIYHPEDPFAEARKHNPHLYALDSVLTERHLDWVFNSLKDELINRTLNDLDELFLGEELHGEKS